MDDAPPVTLHREPGTIEFPTLDPQIAHHGRPQLLEEHRANSDTSLNPARELQSRSRAFADTTRAHSQSDPLIAVQHASSSEDELHHDEVELEYARDGYVRRRDGSDTLPEDDGMAPLRQRINAIWVGDGTPADKSRLIHTLMMERYRRSQQRSQARAFRREALSPKRTASPMSMLSGASQEVYNLSEADLIPTYAPLDAEDIPEDDGTQQELPKPQLGCLHYRRNVKMQCATCEKWYTCRLCHDDNEPHTLPRRDTKHMLCMLCNTPQQAGQVCRMCNQPAANNYCAICKLRNNDPNKSVYHCDDCGMCRLGAGLGKDFFHCKTCAACMSIDAEATHKCIEMSTKSDCPICGDYMFTSSKPVVFMKCGHSIHDSCFKDWCNTSYKCPICSKSITNMESQFRRLDRHIEEQPMPEEYRDSKAYVFCNDCVSRSVTRYHWLGSKCAFCDSYNTTVLEHLGAEQLPRLQQQEQQAQAAGVGEYGMTASQNHTPTEEITSPATNATAAVPVNPPAVRSPSVTSPWLLPHSPTRSVRSASPIVGSYFGTGQRTNEPRRGTPLHDDNDLDFWGGQSPRSNDAMEVEES